jgi:hypothetical protein
MFGLQLFNVLVLRKIKLMSFKLLRNRAIEVKTMPTPKRNRTDDDSPEKIDVKQSLRQLEDKFDAKFDEVFQRIDCGFAKISNELGKKLEPVHQHLKKHDKQISELQKQFDRSQKESELIVTGVPYNENENLTTIVSNISAAIQCGNEVDLRKIEVFRLGQSKPERSAPILMKFSCKFDRKIFYRRYMAKRTLCQRDVGFQTESNSRVYINENLTNYDRKIFNLLLGLKKRQVVASVFSLDGVVCFAKERKDRFQMLNAIDDVLSNDFLKTNLTENEIQDLNA